MKKKLIIIAIIIILLLSGFLIVFRTTHDNVESDIKSQTNSKSFKRDTNNNKQKTVDAKVTYHCNYANYTLEGDKCRVYYYYPADKNYYCEEGTLVYNQCSLNGFYEFVPATHKGSNYIEENFKYNCSADLGIYEYRNGRLVCLKYEMKQVDAKYTYSCDIVGGTLKDDKCEQVAEIEANKTYSCDKGYSLIGDKCISIS